MAVLAGLRERLDWLVDKARRRGLGYRDVLGAMVKAAYPDVTGNPYSGDVAEDVRALAETVASHPDNLALMTKRFKDAFLSQTMAEIAERLGAELYRVIDRTLSGELGRPRNLGELLELADARLGGTARGLANDAVNSRKTVIISDHGYDVYCDGTRRCHLVHGPKGRLSRIAPVVIVEC
jgi:hypothetical protein